MIDVEIKGNDFNKVITLSSLLEFYSIFWLTVLDRQRVFKWYQDAQTEKDANIVHVIDIGDYVLRYV